MQILNPTYISAFIGGLILTIALTPLVKFLAAKYGIVDKPNQPRKIHTRPIALMGGLAIFLSSTIVIIFMRVFSLANFIKIPDLLLIAVILAGTLLMVGGIWDDRVNLPAKKQILFPLAAALITVLAGLRIGYITNPIGGPSNALIYLLPMVGSVLAFIWLMGMMYTTKFLDGLDGLATGIGAIAALTIFILGLDWDVIQSANGAWALALAGSCLGFLVFNWQPAKIFLGEGGSIFLGFMLGVLSIISGSKIATTLLVMGLPALDVLWVIIWRLWRHESPFSHADRKHLHYRLLDLGFSVKETVLFFYAVVLVFGLVAVLNGTLGKILGLVMLVLVMAFLVILNTLKNKLYGSGDRSTKNN